MQKSISMCIFQYVIPKQINDSPDIIARQQGGEIFHGYIGCQNVVVPVPDQVIQAEAVTAVGREEKFGHIEM